MYGSVASGFIDVHHLYPWPVVLSRFASPAYCGRWHRRVAPCVTYHDHSLSSMTKKCSSERDTITQLPNTNRSENNIKKGSILVAVKYKHKRSF